MEQDTVGMLGVQNYFGEKGRQEEKLEWDDIG